MQEVIWNSFKSFCNGTSYPIPVKLQKFLEENDKWVRDQVKNPPSNYVDYWYQVGLVVKQFDGIYDGYNKYAPPSQVTISTKILKNRSNVFENLS